MTDRNHEEQSALIRWHCAMSHIYGLSALLLKRGVEIPEGS
jgi:hypothetical protein